MAVLGPLRVWRDGRDVTPAGTLQRRLLALLVLRRGHVVGVDTAIAALWPDDLPSDPAAALHNHVSRLRRDLPDGLIASLADGYRLDPDGIDLDLDRLEAVLTGGRGTEVDELLAGWSGPAFAELADADVAIADIARLDELRRHAMELSVAERLRAGATVGVVSELRRLVDADPLRERPRHLLMDALAADGRNADALREYDDFRRLLGAELGTAPSAALTERHAALLAGNSPRRVAATRLPRASTGLIGRDRLAGDLVARAESERLVTLVGPGGVGKTRLALEVGQRLLAADPERPVVWCELATGDAAAVPDVVAGALAIDARPGVPLDRRIADVLGDASIVLVFDNCEHVLSAAAALAEHLLGWCAGVRIVATSRERLRVGGEHVQVIPTLPVGGRDAPSAALFVERAQAADPSFAADGAHLAMIDEIVGRLDGLPLAIELAAARLHTHDLGEVAAGLDDRFALLTSGQRTSTRHGSLAAAVAWSYGLLDTSLQATFTSLSVFADAFGVADAAAVADVDLATAGDHLAQLVERSLVSRAPGRAYSLLETLRQFGAEQLRDAGRSNEVGVRYVRHQVAWTERTRDRLLEPGSGALAEFDAALPELRNALGWAIDHGHVELAGQLVVPLLDFGFLRLRPDVLAWAERVLAADPTDASPHAPLVWVIACYAAWMAGDVDECGVRAHRARQLTGVADADLPAEVATAVASFELFRGEVAAARRWYHQAAHTPTPQDPARPLMAAATEILACAYMGDREGAAQLAERELATVPADTPYAAYAWYCAGEADLTAGEARAHGRLTRAIELAERTHTSFVTGTAGASRASLDARTGDPHAAAADYRTLIHHWRRAGMWATQWTMLRSIAGLLARLGRTTEAAVLVGAIRATPAGHRIFGADEVALDELSRHLAEELGPEACAAALDRGRELDGNAAVEHALAALGEP